MKSLRGLEDYYRRIVFSVADQTTPRDNRVDALTKPTTTTPTRLRTALFTRLSHETFVRSCSRLLGGWVEKKIVDTIASSLCPAPAALTSCEGGRAVGAVQSRLLSRFRPSREYFIGIGLRPVAIRLGCVCSSATRTRLFWPIRAKQAPRMSTADHKPSSQHGSCKVPLEHVGRPSRYRRHFWSAGP